MNFSLFDKTTEQKFLEYHQENPKVYDLFCKYAKDVKDACHQKFSAEAIINRIRWHMNVETKGDSFKINNNYRSWYARKLVLDFPEFDGFFEFRDQKSAR